MRIGSERLNVQSLTYDMSTKNKYISWPRMYNSFPRLTNVSALFTNSFPRGNKFVQHSHNLLNRGNKLLYQAHILVKRGNGLLLYRMHNLLKMWGHDFLK